MLVSDEMDWTVRFYKFMGALWQDRAMNSQRQQTELPSDNEESGVGGSSGNSIPPTDDIYLRGRECYAWQARQIWLDFAMGAQEMFQKQKDSLGLSV